MKSHKRWIAIQDHSFGEIKVHAKAADAVLQNGKSLLAGDITKIDGDFHAGDVVRICDEAGTAIAQGLVAVDAASAQDASEPGPIVHRDHLVLL